MNTERQALRNVTRLNELHKNMFIRISDGTKQPPKHHTKKLSAWRVRNREGYVWQVDEQFGSFGITDAVPGVQCRVRMINNIYIANLTSIEVLADPE